MVRGSESRVKYHQHPHQHTPSTEVHYIHSVLCSRGQCGVSRTNSKTLVLGGISVAFERNLGDF